MGMRLTQLSSFFCILLTGSPVLAEQVLPVQETNGFYATLGVGGSLPQALGFTDARLNEALGTTVSLSLKYAGGFAGDVGVGYDFGQIRAEVTYANTIATINTLVVGASGQEATISASVREFSNSAFLSAYWDIPTRSRWVPYVGGGLGYSNRATTNGLVDNRTVRGGNDGFVGYQAKIGMSYLAGPTTDIYAEGTYQGAAGYSVGPTTLGSYNSWGAKVGFRYRFGKPKTVASK